MAEDQELAGIGRVHPGKRLLTFPVYGFMDRNRLEIREEQDGVPGFQVAEQLIDEFQEDFAALEQLHTVHVVLPLPGNRNLIALATGGHLKHKLAGTASFNLSLTHQPPQGIDQAV